MSKVTILEWLELKRSEVYKDSIYQNHGSLSGLARKELEIIDAIRTAIVRLGVLEKAVGEWKYRTKEALDEMENQECQGLIELAEDIRDFGEEGK